MLSKLKLKNKDQRGIAFLTILIGMAFVAIIGTATFVSTVQLLEGKTITEATLTEATGALQEVAEVIVQTADPTQSDDPEVVAALVEEATIQVGDVAAKYSLISLNGDVNVGGSSQIIADPVIGAEGGIYANGNVDVDGNAEVNTDVTATGTVSVGGSATVSGEIVENFNTPLIFLAESQIGTILAESMAEAEAGGIHEGNYDVDGDEVLGPIHITGDLKIGSQDSVTLGGTVYVDGSIKITGQGEILGDTGTLVVETGDIKITGGGRLAVTDIPLIMAVNGDIKCAGNTEICAVLYAPNGSITWTGNANLYGAAIGQEITISGNSVTYPFAQL
jgi:cytoskeletal protein CcmA (bactofilin family)